jgi:endonuclease/exonuclease/phosphatase family metal-dependent hydrolase
MAEQKLGMRGFPVRSNHHGCHLIIFVRPPCEVTAICHDRAAPYWHALCEVRARVGGTELTLANAHLAPSAPTIRRCEAEPLKLVARRAKAGTSIPAIMMGDFNAIPWGDPDPDPPQGIDPGKYAAKRDRAPARAIEQAGFIDVGHHVGDLAPTVGHLGGLPYRCDRIYTTLPSGSIAGYQVIHEAEPYSDHLPVTAVLTIPSPPNIV